ncbi:uncharacterized protein Triagg1_8875 [Trichoderma aggressivum f. europaeum]|uniref:Uncharacterized protein n=1 Tax=Trichoderma aggressivum f. europaeum TaxID=173218 RepID=A0AAE1IZT9_9HYPO|nr:hypothetical protein Triagg1_8875 [Trichoderma aggressivum f. europaeum]
MPVNYVFTESAPSQTPYVRSGRGGAGNIVRSSALPPTSSSSSSSSSSSASRQLPNQRFFSGIGGAGNAHQADKLQPALLRSLETPGNQNPARGHVGRGGAGNVYNRKPSDASSVSSAGSSASSVGEKAKMWASRVSGSFSRK